MAHSHFVPLHKIFFLDARLVGLLDESHPRAFCKAYFRKLLDTIQMKELAPLSVSPAADLDAPGFSGLQELTTSHTSFHYFWEPNHPTHNPNVHIDLYSCAPFSYEDVIRVAHEHFGFAEWTGNFVERTVDPRDRISLQIRGEGDMIIESTVLSAHSRKVAKHAVLS
jgi:hypothetical protein